MNFLVTWFDLIYLFIFAVINWLAFRAGKRAGVKKEQDRILMDWVRHTMKKTGHEDD